MSVLFDEDALVLGIETSCDETSAAVVRGGKTIMSNVIASQVDLHAKYGGVVPEVASRKHVEAIIPAVDTALHQAGVSLAELAGIAVTYGPGLVGGLLVGVSAAKAIAFGGQVPLVGVNHIEGHIYANFLEHPELKAPLICLTVSGGHTDLLYIPAFGAYELLGRTRDDAAGEAFDKVARVMGLGYPGGPQIDRLARDGNPRAVELPRALSQEETFDFSFSGLKTAVLNYIHRERQSRKDGPLPEELLADLAASFQAAVVEVLSARTIEAAKEKRVRTVVMSGGVAANSLLRQEMSGAGAREGIAVYYPSLVLCTDNAAMIACAGYYRFRRGDRASWSLNAEPDLRL
ncbi:MAG: tRNA (adenosine(37)-N6)-threonylcarbamoyltransferase complex transferase subunit TsaD [Firmicutes bacterium]|nr:tRNA (adenosine(37)-N6)-threonylcarbamoyltransferase complex transferase subunit TsaD [Bacillota bacterium]